MSNGPRISIVIPCYNEGGNLRAGVLERVAAFVESHPYCQEVLVVDDGSTDDSATLVEAILPRFRQISLLREPHRGKAGAVVAGALAASGEYILLCDMDQATPIDEVENFLLYLQDGYDVVIGSRAQQREGAPLIRRAMALGFIVLRQLIVGISGLTDTQCGFKCFRRGILQDLCGGLEVYRSANDQTKGPSVTAAFDVELLYLASRLGCRIAEVPVRWHHVGTQRVNPVRESLRGIGGLISIRLNDLSGRYRGFAKRSPRIATE